MSTVATPAWILARQVGTSGGALVLLAGATLLDVLARGILPLGIASSATQEVVVTREVQALLLIGLALLVLVRAGRWGWMLHSEGAAGRASIVILSGLYVQCIALVIITGTGSLLRGSPQLPDGSVLGHALCLAGLAGILSLSRGTPRSMGVLFLILCWGVPALGFPGHGSAAGILPMLVPQLLALGYISLERAQR